MLGGCIVLVAQDQLFRPARRLGSPRGMSTSGRVYYWTYSSRFDRRSPAVVSKMKPHLIRSPIEQAGFAWVAT